MALSERIIEVFPDHEGIKRMAAAAHPTEIRQKTARSHIELKVWYYKLLGLLLMISFSGCNPDSSQKAYLGEWDKLESSYFINRWMFSESGGKLHARHLKQRVQKYRGTESEYTCDIDDKGNIVIHTGIDIKGNISDGKLYLLGEVYQKSKE